MKTTALPPLLRETLAELGVDAIDRWWETLGEDERKSVIELWRTTGASQPCRVQVIAVPANEETGADNSALWHSDFYEHLVNHEIYILKERPFHICTQHPEAKATLQAGRIPQGYVCPLERHDCPMRRLLDTFPEQAVNLRIAFTAAPASELTQSKNANHT